MLTVVGLPRKCQNHGKPIPFIKKMPTKKEKVSTSLHSILIIKHLSYFEVVCWCNVVDSAIKCSLINEDNVEVLPETISCSCLDENVCIESYRKYISPDRQESSYLVLWSVQESNWWWYGRFHCLWLMLDMFSFPLN